jgi:hypothetical protein
MFVLKFENLKCCFFKFDFGLYVENWYNGHFRVSEVTLSKVQN